jgi:hypothetical protein
MLRIFFCASLPVAILACSGVPADDTGQTAEQALSRHTVHSITTISYAPNSFVIGNAYPGWTDEVQGNAQFDHGPGNPNGAYYRWGFLYGENFDRCAWIPDNAASGSGHENGSRCGAAQQQDNDYFTSTFTNGTINSSVSDGSPTHMHYAGSGCSDRNGYGNVAPWRVPATPANSLGEIPNGKYLLWRYVSKDGDWVLVRDPAPERNKPNWYFVQRGCVPLG